MGDETKEKGLNFYKIGFFLLLGLILGVFLAKSVWAFDSDKWTICSAVNLTGGPCDDYWNIFLVSHGFSNGTASADYYNRTEVNNFLSNIYNKSDIDSRLGNLSVNVTGASTEYVNNQTILIKNSILNVTATKDDIEALRKDIENGYITIKSSSSSEFNPIWVLIIVIVIVGILFGINMMNKNKQPPYYPPASNQKIPQNQLQELIKAVNKEKNSEKKQGIPEVVEEE